MVRRLVLHALGEGIRAGTIEAALRATRGYDPWLAARARRGLRAAVRRAGTLTAVQEAPHLLRLAYLLVAVGHPTSPLDDPAAIAAEQAALGPGRPPPRRGPWLLGSLGALGVATLVAALVARWALTPFDPRTLPAGVVLGERLPDVIVALSRGDEAEAARAARRATAADTRRALGDEGTEALAAVIDAARTAAALPRFRHKSDRYPLTNAVVALDRALERRGLPFFVDELSFVDGDRLVPFTMSFYVERDVTVTSGPATVRVVHLWRIDPVNLAPGFLGYTQAPSPAALVLLDRVESDLVVAVLPALPAGEPLELVDRATRDTGAPWVQELERRGGELLRRYAASLPPAETEGVEPVGRLLARRRALVRRWQRTLAELGRELTVPERLSPEVDCSRELAHRVPRPELDEWEAIHRELRRPDRLAAFLRLRDLYARNVQRHEVEHRLDYARGLVPVPARLAAALGLDNPLDAPEGGLAARARQELRAYLAEIVAAPHSPLLGLILLGRHLFAEASQGGAYWYAARVLFLALAEELGVAAVAEGEERARPEDSARLFLAVLARDDAALRGALERVQARTFGEPVPVVTVTGDGQNRPWRR